MGKRIWVVPVLVAVALAVGAGSGSAMPSLGGPTGVVSVPNALVAPVGDLQLAVTYQKVTEHALFVSGGMYQVATEAASLVANRALLAAQATYGTTTDIEDDYSLWGFQALTGVAEGAELWAAYQHTNSDLDRKFWGIGGKFQFLREPQDQAYVAVFASYQRGDGDAQIALASGMYGEDLFNLDIRDKVTKVGLVATKDLTPTGVQGSEWGSGAKLYGTAGLLYLRNSGNVTVNGVEQSGSDSLTRPFLAAEFVTPEGTTLGLEYRWKDSALDAKAVWSAVLRHRFQNGFSAEVGTTNANPVGLGLNDQNVFVRVGYSFAMGQY